MFLGRTIFKSFLLFTFIYTSETEIDESKLIKEYEELIKDSSSNCNLRVASFILHQVLNTPSCKDKDFNTYGQWCIKESELKDIILKTTNELNNDELKKFVVSCFSKIQKDQDKVKDENLKQGLIDINCRAIPFYKDDLKQCFKEEEISQQTLEKIKQELKQQNENKKKLKKGKKTGSFGGVSKILFDNLFVEDLLNKAFESLLNVGKTIYDQIIDKAKIIRSQPPEQPTEPTVTDESEAKKALSESTQEPKTQPESDTTPGNKDDEGGNPAIQNPPLSTQVDVKKGALNTIPSSETGTPVVFDRSHSSSGNGLLPEQRETPQNTNSQEGGVWDKINSFFSQKNKPDTGNTVSISGQGLERENVGSNGSAETGSLTSVQERKVLEKNPKTESDLETPTHPPMGAYLMDELEKLQAIIIDSSELDELIKRLNSKAQDTENQNPDKGSQQLIGDIHSNASLHNREIEEETGSSDTQGSTSGGFVDGVINNNPPKEPDNTQKEPTALKDKEDDIDAIQKAQTQESKLNVLKNIFSSLSSPIINATKYMLLDLPTETVKKTFKEPRHAAEQTLQPPESSDEEDNSSESSEETLPLIPQQTKLQEIMETKYEFLNIDQKLLLQYDEQFIKFNEN